MNDTSQLDATIQRYHLALREFPSGNPEPAKELFSQQEDVTLGNPFGPFARGFGDVAQTMQRAATLMRDGSTTTIDVVSKHVSPDLACLVQVEHVETKLDGRDESSQFSLRTTTVFRREGEVWRIVHRHADPITTPRSPESLIQD